MKLPAVAITAAFAGGICLGLSEFLSKTSSYRSLAAVLAVGILFFLFAGSLLAWRDWLWPAAILSITAWLGLGIFAGSLANRPLPADHILSLLSKAEIPQKTPLRWHGTLRDEPARLPWGYGLELTLTGVEMASGYLPVSGGMRVGFTPHEGEPALPELHAGDDISILAEARLPLVFKDAGAFDRREFLARQGIHLLATLRASPLLEKTGTEPMTWRSRIARVRSKLRERLDNLFPNSPQAAGILRAMLLGDRSFVDRAESADFQKTGVFHVLVVAGLHVGALAFFLFWLMRKIRLPQAAKTLFVLASLLAYVAIVEQRAPVLRAALMAGLVIVGSYFYRRLDLMNSAAIAALILLIANPKFVTDTGFLLSFLAIGAIAGLALPLLERSVQPVLHSLNNWRDVAMDTRHSPKLAQFRLDFRALLLTITAPLRGSYAKWAQNIGTGSVRIGFRIAELFVLSFILQLCMLPLMAQYFHRISIIGPFANLLAVPLTGIIVPLGFFNLGVASILPRIASLIAHPLLWLTIVQQRVVTFLAAIPHGSYRIPGPPAWVTVSFFVIAIALATSLRSTSDGQKWKSHALFLLLLLNSAIVAVYPFHPATRSGDLEVTVLDVAQGDSILVVSPKGSTLLIDGGGAFEGFRGREEHSGPDPGEEAVSAYLWSRGFKRIDAVALTHAHQDHIGGLTAVFENFRVSRLFVGRETAAPAFTRLTQLAAADHIPVEHERRAQNFLWDGVQMDILWPEIAPEEVAPVAKNNDSLVIRLKYGDRTILLPGDAEKQVERQMLDENDQAFLHADVLKVGHHGSKNSTTPEFLSAVTPQISIISAGEENPYGHPSRELLQRLEDTGTSIFRTDQDGAVQVRTDGRSLEVSCFAKCTDRSLASASAKPPNHQQADQQ
jgi:competence protein ComEC